MKKIYIVLVVFINALFIYASEPSVFSAGDLESSKPYGLTDDEKRIVENKNEIKNLKREVFVLKNDIQILKESIEGLKSVISSYSDAIGELKSKYSTFDMNSSEKNSVLEEKISILEENDKKIESTLKELAKLISSSGSKRVNRPKEKKLSSKALYNKALKTFRKHRYDEAEALFLELVSKNYRAAISNYYLGEINYYQKKYKEAVVFYKRSIQLYDKASYIATLLLHTGISFNRNGDKNYADKIFNALIANYPKSKEAKIAKKYL